MTRSLLTSPRTCRDRRGGGAVSRGKGRWGTKGRRRKGSHGRTEGEGAEVRAAGGTEEGHSNGGQSRTKRGDTGVEAMGGGVRRGGWPRKDRERRVQSWGAHGQMAGARIWGLQREGRDGRGWHCCQWQNS
eukprot:357527-Chlamydomonas_euryale.AAC.4